jgi:hypothetical protein
LPFLLPEDSELVLEGAALGVATGVAASSETFGSFSDFAMTISQIIREYL